MCFFTDFWGPGTSWRLLETILEAGAPKNAKMLKGATLFERCFGYLLLFFYKSFCVVFLKRVFFASLTPFRGPRATKEWQKDPQSEQKGGRNAFCGTCENHAIYSMGATWGPLGEGPETICFQECAAKGPP